MDRYDKLITLFVVIAFFCFGMALSTSYTDKKFNECQLINKEGK